jgi:hypothetical protein
MDHAENNLSFVEKAYLQCHCIATEVIQLLLAYLLPQECVLPSRCPAMDISPDFTILAFGRHVTVP